MKKKKSRSFQEPGRRHFGRDNSFTGFLLDPVVSLAILVFTFIALLLSLHQFAVSRGY